ncbi:MAG: SoxR reducing system RseC family protein [Defluviitaleaceae bacterium]|nr:SoxR reducing system RseC family protein [Defluviitaleaceae bacterium]
MHEYGEVIEVNGGEATLLMKRTKACGSCRACRGGIAREDWRVTVKNECGAEVSDRVKVELRTEAFLKAAVMLYGLPAAGLIAGIFAGDFICGLAGYGDYGAPIGIASGIALVVAIYAAAKLTEPKWRDKGYVPVATKVLGEDDFPF